MPGKLNKDVLIYLIFEPRAIALTPSDLPACIIGPLHKVVLNKFAGTYSGSEATITMPDYDPNTHSRLKRGNEVGAISEYDVPYLNPSPHLDIDGKYDLRITIKNNKDKKYYELISDVNACTLGPTPGDLNITVDYSTGTINLPADIGVKLTSPLTGTLSGTGSIKIITITTTGIDLTKILMGQDIVYFTLNATNYKATVIEVLGPNTVSILFEQALSGNITNVIFCRPLAGNVEISYNVFSTQYANEIIEIDSSDKIKSIEMPTPYNPLLLAASIALQNCNGKAFYIVPIPSYDDAGYGSALETIKQSRLRFYNIAILTQSPGAINQAIAHVNERSEPKRGDWRRVWINREFLESPKLICSGTGSKNVSNSYRFDVSGINLIEAGVQSQDKLFITYQNKEYQYTIAVVEANYVIVTSSIANEISGTVPFEIKRFYTKEQQAEYWEQLAASYSNHRVNLVEPDLCEILFDSQSFIVKGYYLAVAKAALSSGILPSWPLAYRGLSGFYRLIHSNDYFDADLIDHMAERGVDIIVQEIEGVPPFSRLARTTDTSNLTKAIQSIISAADYTAYYFLDSLKPYVGKYNINKDLLTLVKAVCGICLTTLIARGLSDYSIISPESRVVDVKQDPEMPTHLIVELDIQPYWPCEKIKVYVYV